MYFANQDENTEDINYNKVVDELIILISTKEHNVAFTDAKTIKEIPICDENDEKLPFNLDYFDNIYQSLFDNSLVDTDDFIFGLEEEPIFNLL